MKVKIYEYDSIVVEVKYIRHVKRSTKRAVPDPQ